MLTLTIEDDQGRKTDVPVASPQLTIGRAKDNQLRLNERNISRKHARLSHQNGGVLIEDLDSYNGVKVNGDRINGRANVFSGDRIQLGDFQLQVHADFLRSRPEEITQKTLLPKKERSEDVTNTEPMVVAALNTGPQPQQQPPPQAPRDRNSFDENTALIRLTDVGNRAAPAPQAALNGPSPRLVCTKGPMAGREWTLSKPEVVIGRGPENDISIDHRSMSRAHAKLVLIGATYRIVDLGSANGTLVNGEPYAQVDLKRGDTVELGHVKLALIWPGEQMPALELPQDNAFDESTEINTRAPRSRPLEAEMSAGATSAGSYKSLSIAVAVGTAVLAVAVVLFAALQSEPKPPPKVVALGPSPQTPQPAPLPPAVATAQAEAPRRSTVPEVMRRANAEMANESWDQAIRILEAGLDAENGNAELRTALDRAENERGAKATFDAANSAAQRGDYQTARDLFQQVPDSSVYSPRAQKKLADPKIANAKAQPAPKATAPSKPRVVERPPPEQAPPPAPPAQVAAAPSPREQAKKLFDQGTKSLSQGKLKEAIEALLEAARLDPKYAYPHRALGIAHAKAGNGDAAVEHYKLYLQLAPNATDAPQVKEIINNYEAD